MYGGDLLYRAVIDVADEKGLKREGRRSAGSLNLCCAVDRRHIILPFPRDLSHPLCDVEKVEDYPSGRRWDLFQPTNQSDWPTSLHSIDRHSSEGYTDQSRFQRE